MPRPLRTAFPILLSVFSMLAAGCSTIYRPVFSPGKTNYVRPPEKKEATAELLPPAPEPGSTGHTSPALPEPTAPAPAPAPGMLDTPPTIPGL